MQKSTDQILSRTELLWPECDRGRVIHAQKLSRHAALAGWLNSLAANGPRPDSRTGCLGWCERFMRVSVPGKFSERCVRGGSPGRPGTTIESFGDDYYSWYKFMYSSTTPDLSE